MSDDIVGGGSRLDDGYYRRFAPGGYSRLRACTINPLTPIISRGIRFVFRRGVLLLPTSSPMVDVGTRAKERHGLHFTALSIMRLFTHDLRLIRNGQIQKEREGIWEGGGSRVV